MRILSRSILLASLFSVLALRSAAQDVRSRTRLSGGSTAVTESQASALTLTTSQTAVRNIQTVLRVAGLIDKTGRLLTARVDPPESTLLKVGQRLRVFSPESKSSMYQARITRVQAQDPGAVIEAELPGLGRENIRRYVMEIVVELGDFLSIPNEAIIEEGDKRVVYVEMHPGHYLPHDVQTGVQGELYTQVAGGLNAGDKVVTIGSFFIDAQYKLTSGAQSPMHDHSGHR